MNSKKYHSSYLDLFSCPTSNSCKIRYEIQRYIRTLCFFYGQTFFEFRWCFHCEIYLLKRVRRAAAQSRSVRSVYTYLPKHLYQEFYRFYPLNRVKSGQPWDEKHINVEQWRRSQTTDAMLEKVWPRQAADWTSHSCRDKSSNFIQNSLVFHPFLSRYSLEII